MGIDRCVLALHGVESARLLFTNQVHLSNVALSNELDLVKAAWADLDVADLDRVGAVSPAEGYRLANLAWGGNGIDRVHGGQMSRVLRVGLDHAQRG